MKVLGIESAGKVASVALVEDGVVLCDFTINGKYTHSKTIMPMLESMKTIMNIDLSEVDAVAVSSGPGSYTGLRIGSSTAKALAQVWQVPIIGVSTLESLANNIGQSPHIICPMLDARRQHAFCAAYKYEDGILETIVPIDLRSVEDFVALVTAYEGGLMFFGDGSINHKALIEEFAPAERLVEVRGIDAIPKASTLAIIGQAKLALGQTDSYLDHQPNYYRPSQAERELQDK